MSSDGRSRAVLDEVESAQEFADPRAPKPAWLLKELRVRVARSAGGGGGGI
jgi:hypothetical protein